VLSGERSVETGTPFDPLSAGGILAAVFDRTTIPVCATIDKSVIGLSGSNSYDREDKPKSGTNHAPRQELPRQIALAEKICLHLQEAA
jgi:hypothetical protein